MKILIDQNECAIFIEVAEHMDVELDAPKLLYEIEDKRLAAVAIALGGIQFIETAPQPAPATLAIAEPAMDEHRSPVIIHAVPGSGKKKPLHLSEMAAKKADLCVICGGPIIGRGPRALTCSDSCSEELKRVRLLEKRGLRLTSAPMDSSEDEDENTFEFFSDSDEERDEKESEERRQRELDELEEAGPVEGADPLA